MHSETVVDRDMAAQWPGTQLSDSGTVCLSDADFDRSYYHPEQQRDIDLAEALELYVWHGAHHLAHIQGLRDRSGW